MCRNSCCRPPRAPREHDRQVSSRSAVSDRAALRPALSPSRWRRTCSFRMKTLSKKQMKVIQTDTRTSSTKTHPQSSALRLRRRERPGARPRKSGPCPRPSKPSAAWNPSAPAPASTASRARVVQGRSHTQWMPNTLREDEDRAWKRVRNNYGVELCCCECAQHIVIALVLVSGLL